MRGRAGLAAVTAAALAMTAASPVAARALALGAAGLGDPIFPNLGNGGYDVADYVLDLRYDATNKLLDGVTTIRAGTTQALDRFNLATLPALNLTPSQLEWTEARLGPIPQEAYGILVADTDDPKAFDFTGLETQTLTIYKPAYLLQAEDRIGSHMMHELVHSWFGDSVGPADWSALWLNEGHADLYGLMHRYERGWPDSAGNTTLEARMRTTYAKGDIWRAEAGPVARPTAATLFHPQRYAGGALVLYALRQRVGAAAFDAIERAFLARYRHGIASTQDYIDTATEVSADAGVRPFLTHWLYGTATPAMPGHPEWTLEPVPPTPPPTRPAPYVVGE